MVLPTFPKTSGLNSMQAEDVLHKGPDHEKVFEEFMNDIEDHEMRLHEESKKPEGVRKHRPKKELINIEADEYATKTYLGHVWPETLFWRHYGKAPPRAQLKRHQISATHSCYGWLLDRAQFEPVAGCHKIERVYKRGTSVKDTLMTADAASDPGIDEAHRRHAKRLAPLTSEEAGLASFKPSAAKKLKAPRGFVPGQDVPPAYEERQPPSESDSDDCFLAGPRPAPLEVVERPDIRLPSKAKAKASTAASTSRELKAQSSATSSLSGPTLVMADGIADVPLFPMPKTRLAAEKLSQKAVQKQQQCTAAMAEAAKLIENFEAGMLTIIMPRDVNRRLDKMKTFLTDQHRSGIANSDFLGSIS